MTKMSAMGHKPTSACSPECQLSARTGPPDRSLYAVASRSMMTSA
jgi:hypothetical protein